MHLFKTSKKGPLGLLAGLAALVAIAVTPMFGSTAYAETPQNANKTAAVSEFIIPAVPVSTLAEKLSSASPAPVIITLSGPVAGLFPASGQLLLGKTELVTYTTGSTTCGTTGANQVCLTERGSQKNPPPGPAPTPGPPLDKQHAIGTRVQLATQLTADLPAATGGTCLLGTRLEATTVITPGAPKGIVCIGASDLSKEGSVSIGHETTQTPNLLGNQSSEMFKYNNNAAPACAAIPDRTYGVDAICLTDRGQQPGNGKYEHKANGFNQPCNDGNWESATWDCPPKPRPAFHTLGGRSLVTEHFQISVKSNEGFFPTATMLIYDVDANNDVIQMEVMGYNNVADKIKPVTVPGTQFHVTSRGGNNSTWDEDTDEVLHPAGSIVTGAHGQLVCRNGNVQPGVDTDFNVLNGYQEPAGQVAGTSLAAYPICYTQTQPGPAPKALGGPAGFKDSTADLSANIDANVATVIVPVTNGALFAPLDLIKIDNEEMMVNGVAGNDLTVVRKWHATAAAPHNAPADVFIYNMKKLDVPIAGNPLTTLIAIGAPFLSTGGYDHPILGPVALFDSDGASGDAEDLDGDLDTTDLVLGLKSPCLLDYTPGTNLQVTLYLNAGLKALGTPDTGKIKVVLDTIHNTNDSGPPPVLDGDECDDPAGWSDITVTTYADPGGAAGPYNADTDSDACPDVRELNYDKAKGGHRDAWNRWDYWDVNGDGKVDLLNDIRGVIAKWNTNSAVHDRHNLRYGPFDHNRAPGDGIVDLLNDIRGVIAQWNNNCLPLA